MAHKIGNVAFLQFKTDFISNQDYYVAGAGLSTTKDALEHTAFGDNDRQRVGGGLQDWSLDMNGFWNDKLFGGGVATAAEDDSLFDAFQSVQSITASFYLGGQTAGADVLYTGSCHISGYSVVVPVDGPITFTATLVGSGSLTRSAIG